MNDKNNSEYSEQMTEKTKKKQLILFMFLLCHHQRVGGNYKKIAKFKNITCCRVRHMLHCRRNSLCFLV